MLSFRAMANDPAQIFLTMGCGACHTLTAAGTTGTIGPNLDDLPNVAGTRQPGVAAADYVASSIQNPDDFIVPGFPPGTASGDTSFICVPTLTVIFTYSVGRVVLESAGFAQRIRRTAPFTSVPFFRVV